MRYHAAPIRIQRLLPAFGILLSLSIPGPCRTHTAPQLAQLSIPILLSPANNSTTPDFTPTFDWEDVPGADHYRVQVDDNADFSSPAADSQPSNSTYTPS
ncbi:MAG: hypothetical protein JXB30_07735, partial [Anaerolineae bacterium]|nr:hypothetical protein [Anaerolineae bacterium]